MKINIINTSIRFRSYCPLPIVLNSHDYNIDKITMIFAIIEQPHIWSILWVWGRGYLFNDQWQTGLCSENLFGNDHIIYPLVKVKH